MNAQPIFSARTVFWLVTAGTLSFGAALAVLIFGQSVGTTAKPNTFSTSAIGHRAFIEILDRVGFRILVSRSNSVGKVGQDGLLVLAEPQTTGLANLFSAPNLLYVLPKRTGLADPDKQQWLQESSLLPLNEAQDAASLIVPDASVVRLAGAPVWSTGLTGSDPDIEQLQLIRSGRLTPVLASNRGILIGRMEGDDGLIWVLSDPDLLSNHGLRRGDNALLMVRAIEEMNPMGGLIVVDETIHGFGLPPSLWRNLFEFPIIVVTIQALATLVILLLAATDRFGAPIPLPRVIPEGKAALLANTADLLSVSGHGRELLRRYVKVTLRDVARRLQLPGRLEREEVIAQLDRIAEARGISGRLAEIDQMAGEAASRSRDSGRILQAAGRLFQWKREMLDEPGRRSRG